MILKLALFLLLFPFCSFNSNLDFELAHNHYNNIHFQETKKHGHVINPDADFSDSSILLLINHEYSLGNKAFTIEDFPEIGIESIEDLTDCKEGTYKKDVFQKVFKATLIDKSRENVFASIEALEDNEYLDCAEPNYFYHLDSTTATGQYSNNQWAIENIELDKAWDISTGRYEVKVGVIDSGIDADHQDFSPNFIYPCGDNYWPNSLLTEGDDISGHGTHVAGIIGANGWNSIGVNGVCWLVNLYSYRVTSDIQGHEDETDTSVLISAISGAANDGVDMLNMSLGSTEYSYSLYSSINSFDGLVVCAAGNRASNSGDYPAFFDLDNIISVGNSTSSNSPNSSSNYSSSNVDLFAPGTEIYSTDSTYVNSFGYTYKTGTSMAAPFVTGVAALMKSTNPLLTVSQIKAAIMDTVDVYSSLTNKCVTSGILNAYNAVKSIIPSYNSNGIEVSSLYCLAPSETHWFTFNGTSGGYQIETTGSLTTQGALYTNIQTNPINPTYYGNQGSNFLMLHYTTNSNVYYLKVSNIGTTSGFFNLKVTRIHDHNYAGSFEYVNTTYHRAYCTCGFSKLECHYFHVIPGQPGLYKCAGCGTRIFVP